MIGIALAHGGSAESGEALGMMGWAGGMPFWGMGSIFGLLTWLLVLVLLVLGIVYLWQRIRKDN